MSAENLENRKLTELYGPVRDENGGEVYTEEMLGKIPTYKIEIKAKVRDVSYPRQVWWVKRDNFLLLKQSLIIQII